jgi:hypothetical protein
METRLLSKFVQTLLTGVIFSLLGAAAGAQAQSWNLTGNAGTDPSTNFLGTTDGRPLIVQPGNGNVGIGTTSPLAKLHAVANGGFGGENADGTSQGNSVGLLANGNSTQIGILNAENRQAFAINIDNDGGTAENRGAVNFYDKTNGAWHQDISLNNGNVGIGTPNPQAQLDVLGDARFGSAPNQGLRVTETGGITYLQAGNGSNAFGPNGTEALMISPWYSTRTYLYVSGSGNVGIGTANPQALLDVAGMTRTPVLQITGGSDLAEPFEASGEIKPGMVVAIDPAWPGRLRIADKAYDRTVAGIVSGANGINPGLTMKQQGTVADGSLPVALTGRVYCWADASNGPINPGDLLTASNTPGHAMKVANYAKAHGAIIGKAMTKLQKGKGLVLVLVTLQ